MSSQRRSNRSSSKRSSLDPHRPAGEGVHHWIRNSPCTNCSHMTASCLLFLSTMFNTCNSNPQDHAKQTAGCTTSPTVHGTGNGAGWSSSDSSQVHTAAMPNSSILPQCEVCLITHKTVIASGLATSSFDRRTHAGHWDTQQDTPRAEPCAAHTEFDPTSSSITENLVKNNLPKSNSLAINRLRLALAPARAYSRTIHAQQQADTHCSLHLLCNTVRSSDCVVQAILGGLCSG